MNFDFNMIITCISVFGFVASITFYSCKLNQFEEAENRLTSELSDARKDASECRQGVIRAGERVREAQRAVDRLENEMKAVNNAKNKANQANIDAAIQNNNDWACMPVPDGVCNAIQRAD